MMLVQWARALGISLEFIFEADCLSFFSHDLYQIKNPHPLLTIIVPLPPQKKKERNEISAHLLLFANLSPPTFLAKRLLYCPAVLKAVLSFECRLHRRQEAQAPGPSLASGELLNPPAPRDLAWSKCFINRHCWLLGGGLGQPPLIPVHSQTALVLLCGLSWFPHSQSQGKGLVP